MPLYAMAALVTEENPYAVIVIPCSAFARSEEEARSLFTDRIGEQYPQGMLRALGSRCVPEEELVMAWAERMETKRQ